MSDNYADTKIETTRGASIDECIANLNKIYGEGGYRIQSKKQVRKPGLFHSALFELEFYVTPRRRGGAMSAEAFEREKQQLLKTQAPVVSVQHLARLEKKLDELATVMTESSMQRQQVHPAIKEVEEILEDNEFSPSYIRGISHRLENELTLSQLDDRDIVHARVVSWIEGDIRVLDEEDWEKRPKVAVLVGPTGVGKTTTLAKLAVKYVLAYREREDPPFFTLMTADNFRTGAQDQLQIYANVLEVPCFAVQGIQDLKENLSRDRCRRGISFIDTTGSSPSDFDSIAATCNLISKSNCEPDVYLVLSAATKARDLRMIIHNYSPAHYSSVIISKFDETERIGNVVSVLKEYNIPASYITDGQKMPDIRRASVSDFMNKLTGFAFERDEAESTASFNIPVNNRGIL